MAKFIKSDLKFILDQILIAEANAAGTPLSSLIPQVLLPWGLRTVNGSFNNIVPGQSTFGQADQVFPRLVPPVFRTAETVTFDPDGPGGQAVGDSTSYTQTSGAVFDSQPRIISNLIADQTATNPAAVAATFDPGLDGILGTVDDTLLPGAAVVDATRADGTPFQTYLIPNVAPDEGLSAPFNSWFTLFGQFFDHGLDLTNKGGSGTVFVPLQPDDPLFNPASPQTNFMVLTRATNQPGPDGVLGTVDDIHEHVNQTTPFVDQNQTYTSHPSHQAFLREYVLNGKPVATGRMLDGVNGGLANWAEVKAQARNLLGIDLTDADLTNLPLLATDAYGNLLRGAHGLAQIVMPGADGISGTADDVLVEGNLLTPISTVGAVRTGHAFLDDIAHSAAPRNSDGTMKTADADNVAGVDDGVAGSYDNELLDAHFATGDGRGNENIGLTTVHTIFHAEHNRQIAEIKATILATVDANGQPDTAFIQQWLVPGANPADGVQDLEWNGERLFQAARFATEMQYQHLVFEEFARKVSPDVNLFSGYHTDINPAIMNEFAQVVYRFGHSMLTETVARTNADGTANDIGLIQAFLNPLEFTNGGLAGTLTPEEAAASVVRGMTRQVGNEIDEFVTEALRNNLLGLPLDLATVNMTRARDTGMPSLNAARAMFFADTGGNAALRPYSNWVDFGLGLKHPESLINFVAAYGTHSSITSATTVADKRAAASLLVLGGAGAPADSVDFMNSTSTWAGTESGLNLVEFWIGGLAERQASFGGLLGSTFNFVFETQMESLQNGDRHYYLSRTAGLNFLPQLEANSFSELIMRNLPGVTHLPFDSFSRPDFTVELANIGATGPILDDPLTPYDERTILTRMADGTVRALTDGQHIVMGGTAGNDRIQAGNENDTVWGDGGNDRIEGGTGDDGLMGGDGDDIITDLFGIDVLKGGDGNDAMNAGPGLGDLILGGAGQDFIVAGADGKESFAGQGNDFVIAGDDADTVFGNEGDDWIEGGNGADLLQGDMGNPFETSTVLGNDVFIGDGGDDDYDAESGDDIMLPGPGIERNTGMLGFDWVTYAHDPQAADADMLFGRVVIVNPIVDALRDRFDLVEGLSGGGLNDVLRGDNRDAALLSAVDPVANQDHVLRNIALINGLQEVVGAGVTSFSAGNIILGGEGSDLIEGRGGNDLIDGDKWLNVRLTGGDNNGVAFSANSMSQIQARVFAGEINPGNIQIVREILTAPAGNTDIDRAVYADVRANYVISAPDANGRITVTHIAPAGGGGVGFSDGSDTLINIERLIFRNQAVLLNGVNTRPTGTDATLTILENASITLSALHFGFSDADGGDKFSGVRIDSLTEAGSLTLSGVGVTAGQFISAARIALGDLVFTPTATASFTFRVRDEMRALDRTPNTFTANVLIVNSPPTGALTISDTTPTEGQVLTASTAGIVDADGTAGAVFNFQWQSSTNGLVWTNIAGATAQDFTPSLAHRDLLVRVAATYIDGGGTTETVLSAATGGTGRLLIGNVLDNILDGAAFEDNLQGRGGNDTLNGRGGNDILSGGTGADVLNGEVGDDIMAGNGGNDTYVVDSVSDVVTEIIAQGIDVVQTTLASYTLGDNLENLAYTQAVGRFNGTGNAVNNSITGGSDADTLNGLGGNDRLIGGAGNDTLTGGVGNDVFAFNAGSGQDVIQDFDAVGAGGQDRLDLSGLGITAVDFAARVVIADLGTDTRITIDGVDTITLVGVSGVGTNTITQADFLLA